MSSANDHELLLYDSNRLQAVLKRLVRQLLEDYGDFANTVVIGLQPRGVYLAERLMALLEQELRPASQPEWGRLDVTFHRDDIRRRNTPPVPSPTEIPFSLENKRVILVDDVLFTGRTVRAALDAMLSYGRPSQVALLVLVDRKRMRHLPVEASYVGIQVDTVARDRVLVEWAERNGADAVKLLPPTEQKTPPSASTP